MAQLDEVLSSGMQLPAACYTDISYHEGEIGAIFEPGWMAIGFASSYITDKHAWAVEILGKPLIITRDESGQLHVFHNVCRHRGHLLVDKGVHSSNVLCCPYHSWCYGLNGRFIKAPFWGGSNNSAPGDQQKNTMGLIPVRFAVWYDILFVNLSGDAESFDDFIAPVHARWSGYRQADQLRCFSRRDFSLQGNWKLAAENFLDNYHLPWVHPELGSSIQASLGLAVENLQLSDSIIGFSHPTAGADKGKTATPLPPWPSLSDVDAQRQDLLFLFPNTCFVMEGYYLWTMILFPTAVDRCDEKLALYVVGDDAMDDRFDESRNQLSDVIYTVNSQDETVVENLQAGRRSDAASHGVYADAHDQLGKWFHQRVARKFLQCHDSLI